MLSWVVFGAVVSILLACDLLVFHRHASPQSLKASILWSVFWVGLGLSFAGFVAVDRGEDAALAYLTAFLIEKSLSVDNLFVFIAIFRYFSVAERYQHRVLFWGIVGALALRGAFIFAGVALLNQFHWLVFILGVVLLATGAKLAASGGEDVHPQDNVVVRWASRTLPVTGEMRGEHFLVREGGRWMVTPLVLVLIAIETTDLMFAVDSVPAVLAVSRDAFVVYSSNIFAILGLRALYFALSGAIRELRYLRPALAVILILIGVKMLLSDVFEVATWMSLSIIGGILAAATVASLLLPQPGVQGDDDV